MSQRHRFNLGEVVHRLDPHGRRRMTIASVVGVVAVAKVSSESPILGILLAATIAAAVLAYVLHDKGILSPLWPLAIVGLFLPLNGLRPVESASIGDLMLVMTGFFAVVFVRRSYIPAQIYIILIGTLVVAAGGTFGMMATQDWSGTVELVKFVLGAPMVIVIIMLLNPNRSMVLLLLTAYAVGGVVTTWAGMFQAVDPAFGRASGFGVHVGHLALAAQLSVFVWLGWCLTTRDWRVRAGCAFLAAFCLYGVMLSGTRTALLGVVAGVVAIALAARRKGVVFLGSAGVAVVSAYYLVVPFLPNSQNIYRALGQSKQSVQSNEAHVDVFRQALQTIGDRPWTGSGFSQGQVAHNLVLQIISLGGIVALIGFLVIWIPIILIGIQRVLLGVDHESAMALCLMAGVGAYFVFAQFQPFVWDRHLWFFITLALYAQIPFNKTPDTRKAVTSHERSMEGAGVDRPPSETSDQLAHS